METQNKTSRIWKFTLEEIEFLAETRLTVYRRLDIGKRIRENRGGHIATWASADVGTRLLSLQTLNLHKGDVRELTSASTLHEASFRR